LGLKRRKAYVAETPDRIEEAAIGRTKNTKGNLIIEK
jgi:hypothetical protein